MRRPWTRAVPPAGPLVASVALGTLQGLATVALAACAAYLIARAAEQPPILFLSMAIVGVRAFALARAVLRYLERLSSHDAALRAATRLRGEFFDLIATVAPAGLRSSARVSIGRRLVHDVDALQDLPLRVLQPAIVSVITAIASCTLLALILPEAGLTLALLLTCAVIAGVLLQQYWASDSERRLSEAADDLAREVQITIDSLDVLQAYGALDDQVARTERVDERVASIASRTAWGAGALAAVLSAVAVLAACVLAWLGASRLGNGVDGPGIAVLALTPLAVVEVVAGLPQALSALRRVRAVNARITEILPDPPLPGVPDDRASDTAESGERGARVPELRLIEFSAAWPESDDATVRDVDLRLAPGERVLLSGPSGAGKTTLAAALVRFVEYQGGYRLDDLEARPLGARAVRQRVGLSEQHPHLFDTDLRHNLLLAREGATDAELLAALDRVGLGNWASSRGGLDLRVGDRGASLSGGEAQRIALARLLIAQRPILVLDEPAANVDEAAAELLLRDLLEAADESGSSVLLISHVPVPEDLITRRLTLPSGPERTPAGSVGGCT